MKKALKKHPFAIRWFHWINFPILAIMVWSGMLIYWANDVYRVGWGDKTILRFFPDSFYEALSIPYRLAEGMSLHFVFMWLFTINGLLYVLYLVFSGEWRLIFPGKKSFKESWQVVLHDLRIKKQMPPQKKYNAAQRIAYTGVIFMGLGSLLTGLAIFKPVQFNLLTAMLGGYEWARAEHFILTILFVLFFVLHVIQVILAGWNNFRGMVTGLDVLKEDNVNNVQMAAAQVNKHAEEQVGPAGNIHSGQGAINKQPIDEMVSKNEPEAKKDVSNQSEEKVNGTRVDKTGKESDKR